MEEVLNYFQPQEAPRWHPEFCGEQLALDDSNRTVTKKSNLSIGGVLSEQPRSRYSVHIVFGRYIVIGFATYNGFQKNASNHFICGWCIDVDDGTLFSQNGFLGMSYGHPIPEGSVVTAIHDRSQHTIEFQVNGTSLGIAFTNIPHVALFAAADFYGPARGEIRIVDYS